MKSDTLSAVVLSVLVLGVISLSTKAQNNRQDRQLIQSPSPQPNTVHRVALVIGNGAYQFAGKLANPPNDAALVASTLRQLGFEVRNGSNLTQREMKQRLREFGQTLRVSGGVGLFYFAGHGVQAKGHNYLVPVDADIQTQADFEDSAVDLNYVLGLMDDAKNALNIVVLDACRNDPFSRSFRSAEAGLAQVKAPTGTLIAYATAPDSIAADGTGTNSPYTEELVKQMQASGVLVETMFRRVTEEVSARTNGKQEPWFSANVKGDFYFKGGSSLNPTIELSFWESIKSSRDPEDFRAYLRKYPEGAFAELAKNRLKNLSLGSDNTESRPRTASETNETPPQLFSGSYGFRVGENTYFNHGTLFVSAGRIEFDFDGIAKVPRANLPCVAFMKSYTKNSSILGIQVEGSDNHAYEFATDSLEKAVEALRTIKGACGVR